MPLTEHLYHVLLVNISHASEWVYQITKCITDDYKRSHHHRKVLHARLRDVIITNNYNPKGVVLKEKKNYKDMKCCSST